MLADMLVVLLYLLRIRGYTGDMVTSEFKGYSNNGSKMVYTLKIDLIRKLVRHIPPHYFNIIHHCGLLASRVKSQYKAITDKLLAKPSTVKPAQDWRKRQAEFRGEDPMLCKICPKVMAFVTASIPTPLKLVQAKSKTTFP
ncbi:MAG: transposase [Magnetococcales bacterium]|nr:transposase [Magnetococcales bacterium]